jgi:hypothetical protein
MSTEEQKVPTEMVYMGRRLGKGSQLYDAWQFMNNLDVHAYKKFRPHGCAIGTIFIVDVIGENSVSVSSARDPKPYQNAATVAEWETLDRAAYNRAQEIKIVRRIEKTNKSLGELLDPVKRLYRRVPASDRTSLLVMIIKEMQECLY